MAKLATTERLANFEVVDRPLGAVEIFLLLMRLLLLLGTYGTLNLLDLSTKKEREFVVSVSTIGYLH